MPSSTKIKQRPICKICPKPKKRIKIPKVEPKIEEEEEYYAVEEEEEKIEEPCADAGGYSDFELMTAQNVLEEIWPSKKRKKPAFFASCSEKIRYENLVPCDVTNDHQYRASTRTSLLNQMSVLRVTSDPRWKRLPAIIGTIGPSCFRVDQIVSLLLSGVNVLRINLAYGDRCCHVNAIRNSRAAEKIYTAKMGLKCPIAVMVDLRGVQIKTGRICKLHIKDCSNPQIFLEKDTSLKLTTNKYVADKCTPRLIYFNYEPLLNFIRPGMKIYLDEGAVKLIANKVEEGEVTCTVEEEGYLGNERSVHLPMIPVSIPAYTPTDIEDLIMAIEEEVDAVTLPRARHANVLREIRGKLVEQLMISRRMKERPILLFAKISNYEGLVNIDGIIAEADGIVIQRGALAMDLPAEKVCIAQREIIAKCIIAGKPVICSTELLRSMMDKIQVSRSNVADVANCIQEGADCLSLTAEVAIGNYPNETVEMANHIVREAEAATFHKHVMRDILATLDVGRMDPKIAIAMAACSISEKVRASAIIVLTTSGKSARFISWFRPRAVVVAVTRYERTARQLNFWRCVVPLLYRMPCTVDWFMDMERKFQHGIVCGREFGFIRPGDPLVLVSGYGKDIGYTNCVRIVYASTEPAVYLDHPLEFYSNVYVERDLTRPQDKFPYHPCK